ncbi:MAG: hypothetical protein IT223_10705 [Crocinitomicaceae bacterium]|nr:hypothetical protein [Crocinitomicaceae bacterium]
MLRTLTVSFFSLLLSFSYSNLLAQGKKGVADEIPSKGYWLNADFEFSMQTFNKKILIVEIWHPLSLEGRTAANQLEEFTTRNPQFQLLSIILGDTAMPFSRNELFQFARENHLNHPIGIAKDLTSFKSVDHPKYPTVLVYDGKNEAFAKTTGLRGVDSLLNVLEKRAADVTSMGKYETWQIIPQMSPSVWADPIIECPTYIAMDGPRLFITENARSRILAIDRDGNYTGFAGGTRGYENGSIQFAKFMNPGGLAYRSATGDLFVADTDNNRVRLVSFESDIVSSVGGTGRLPLPGKQDGMEIGLPTDLIFESGKLMVLSGFTNELLELDPTTARIKKRTSLMKERYIGGSRVYAKNIAAGSKFIYVVLSDGSILQIDKKNEVSEFYHPASLRDGAGGIAEKGGKFYITLPFRNEVAQIEEGKLIPVSGGQDGFIDNQGAKAAFRSPFDLAESGGDLIVSDRNNNSIRIVELSGKTMHIRPDPLSIAMTFDDSPDEMESVVLGPLIVGKGRNTIDLKLDLGNYGLAADGRNEFTEIDQYGMNFSSDGLSDKGLVFSFDPIATNGFVQFILHLTLEKKNSPEQLLFKNAFINIEYEVIEGEENSQSVDYKPNIRPF